MSRREAKKMASKTTSNMNKVGITMNDETFAKLEHDSKALGLTKSAYISMIINTVEKGGKRVKLA